MPLFTVSSGVLREPRDSAGARKPWTMTVTSMTSILIRASVLALAN